MAETGWPEGSQKARKLLSKVDMPLIEDTHSATYHDVSGAYVDVGQFVEGVPECMVDFRADTRKARFAHIVVGGCFSAGYTADTIMERGVCIAALIDALESAGVRCSVELITRHGIDWETSVRLKETTDALNLDTLAFAIAHPACFRRLGFAVCERETEATRIKHGFGKSYGGYGQVIPLGKRGDALVFDGLHLGQEWTTANAGPRIREIVERYTEKA